MYLHENKNENENEKWKKKNGNVIDNENRKETKIMENGSIKSEIRKDISS